MYGMNGKILWADLTNEKMWVEEISEEVYRKYLGGVGLGAYILNREIKGKIDALGPDNILGFVTGVFNSHNAPLGGRLEVVGKSPMTGTWGDSNCGGKFAPELKNTGFDALFVKGIAKRPVYIKIIDDKYSIEDASSLWGKDAYETETELKKIDPKGQAMVIGVPGEKMLYAAAIMNEYGRASGRSGLAAVMGSKKLKGVFARGTKKVPVYDEKMLMETIKKAQIQFRNSMNLVNPWHMFGTTQITESSHLNGDTPIKNWAGVGIVDFGEENAKKISGEEIRKDVLKSYGCAQCTLACGGHVKRETRYGTVEGHRLEYEGTGAFGGLNLIADLDAMSMSFELCNRYGLDIITTGAVIAFANELYERGILTEKDIGFKIGFGNPDAEVKLTELIGKGEGIGRILGMGQRYAAKVIGKGAEESAMEIGGQDLPMHDPRLMPSLGNTYISDATPGRHTAGGIGFNEGFKLVLPFKHKESWAKVPRYEYHGKAYWQLLSVAGQEILNSTGMCLFSTNIWPNSYPYTDLIKAITGWDMTEDDLVNIGWRIQMARHLFNAKQGINQYEIKPPGRVMGYPPLKAGPTAGVSIDYETLRNEYLTQLGLSKDGKPDPNILKKLDIEPEIIAGI
ncbi:aldehyde ferredoxin oxidoreductase family protein [Thermoplasma sp.]|uniref:aldehyde ferredoxin oxidoreductase family protein n=1 Tax=Thermoplasma sp. TaxID=1973142 RepID=UPI00128A031C|nr:aldehyde ferredoxin oxidoreductase family protein [Thermoplasma sp.]KAA8922279.1 MAG: aldehyde ferredoxin oxidoreductase family protein [Thermoplasma sp.]